MRHFAHYIKRKVVIAGEISGCSDVLPYAEEQPKDQGFEYPVYHSVPLNSGVASRVNIGDTIWLFSQLSSPWGKLPPSLDGMIKVEEINKNARMPGRYWFRACSIGSKWYFLYDASKLIAKLKAINAKGEVDNLIQPTHPTIGQALQFFREISDPLHLIEHATKVDEMKPDFISYRMVDGTELAFELVKRLLDSERIVFWDRWSLPRRLAERDENVDSKTLGKL